MDCSGIVFGLFDDGSLPRSLFCITFGVHAMVSHRETQIAAWLIPGGNEPWIRMDMVFTIALLQHTTNAPTFLQDH